MEKAPRYRKTKPPKEFSSKLTVEEKLLGSIMNEWPSVKDLRSRPDYVMPSLEEYLSPDHKLLTEQVQEVLGSLTGRERFVLRSRFGLDGEKCKTFKEVGQELQPPRSESTIRRIEKRALEKLHHSPARMKLRPYIELE